MDQHEMLQQKLLLNQRREGDEGSKEEGKVTILEVSPRRKGGKQTSIGAVSPTVGCKRKEDLSFSSRLLVSNNKGCQYTWSRKLRDGSYTYEHLDRFIACDKWLSLMRDISVIQLSSTVSDHKPIMLSFDFADNRRLLVGKPNIFHFETWWAGYEKCEEIVSEAWSTDGCQDRSLISTARKIQRTGLNLKVWSKKELPAIPIQIKDLQAKLDSLEDMTA
ncbi:hypothetical protein RIF29_21285 [Crotalaria pallida]|uniref:Uncharacterized protein n=1 Tax=Crotalaria pallida TaxID=3830 RepID=A0AAN9I897_CROPI